MDLWDYLKALRRWWWLAAGVPLLAGLLAILLLPSAPWETQFRAMVLFPGNPDLSGSVGRGESIVLDDTAVLMSSGEFQEAVHAHLPAALGERISPAEIGDMLQAQRYSRAVTVTVVGASPDEVRAVAEGAEAVLADAINAYLVPAEMSKASVEIIDHTGEPAQQTRERWLAVGAITVAAALVGLGLVALAEGLRRSYVAKYGAR